MGGPQSAVASSRLPAPQPLQVASLYHRGLMLARGKRFEEALAAFSDVIARAPGDRLVFEARGLVYRDAELYDLAIKDFDSAIALDPSQGEAHLHRAICYQRVSQFKVRWGVGRGGRGGRGAGGAGALGGAGLHRLTRRTLCRWRSRTVMLRFGADFRRSTCSHARPLLYEDWAVTERHWRRSPCVAPSHRSVVHLG